MKKEPTKCQAFFVMFTFPEPTPRINNISRCNMNSDLTEDKQFQRFIIRSVSNRILDRQFNFTNSLRYFSHFKNKIHLSIYGFKGFDLNFLKNLTFFLYVRNIEFIDVRLEFYHNKKKITSCKELIDFNPTRLNSIFQMIFDKKNSFILTNVEYKSKICPLLFQNASM